MICKVLQNKETEALNKALIPICYCGIVAYLLFLLSENEIMSYITKYMNKISSNRCFCQMYNYIITEHITMARQILPTYTLSRKYSLYMKGNNFPLS